MPVYLQYLYFVLVIFLLYRRIKDGIGFQKYSSTKLWAKITLFSVACILTIAISFAKPLSLVGDLAGIIVGFGMMYFATINIRFQRRKNGLYYRTNILVEVTVLLIFFARFLFRFHALYQAIGDAQSIENIENKLLSLNDPYTGGAVLVLCSYYISYFWVVLKKGKHN